MTIKTKINLSIVIFFILILLIVVFAVYPILKEIKNNTQNLLSQKKDLITIETEIENLAKFQTVYNNLGEVSNKIKSLFVNLEVPVEFISFLEDASKTCQLETEIHVSSVGKIENDPWSSFVFQINSTGSFSNFAKFLDKLENNRYLIEIQNLNISNLTEKEISPTGIIKANFSFKVFAK